MAQANKKELTELQKSFLDHLFSDECHGNFFKAKMAAGYSHNTRTGQIVEELYEEIVEVTKKYLASKAPKAYLAMENVLDDPTQAAAMTKLKAAAEILNRIGVNEKKDGNVNITVPSSGIVILPPKRVQDE